MENRSELQQVLYHVLKTQIQFGVYRFGERLPTMEDACRWFQVSIKTIRAAYQYLQKEHYITISKSIGVKVVVHYSEQEMKQNVQEFFSCRKNALIDLSYSIQPLFCKAQWLALKTASPERLREIEQLNGQKSLLPPYRMIQHFYLIYGALKNDMLMRLVWQVFTFYQAPFLSLTDNVKMLEVQRDPLLHLTSLCRDKKWQDLLCAIKAFQKQFSGALRHFYANDIVRPPAEQQESFCWSGYKKASQRCYTLAMELLSGISRGIYPAGSFLPSLEKLAKEKKSSLRTMRRAVSVLNNIGAVKSINGVGTQVLSLGQCAQNCNFTDPVVRERLINFAQSLQILALSCEEVAQITMDAIKPNVVEELKERLRLLKRVDRQELAVYGVLELLAHYAPFQAVKKVYDELFHQLLWGYPLRGLPKDPKVLETQYRPGLECLLANLEKSDNKSFAVHLKKMMLYELRFAIELLIKLDIQEAEDLFIPQMEDGMPGEGQFFFF